MSVRSRVVVAALCVVLAVPTSAWARARHHAAEASTDLISEPTGSVVEIHAGGATGEVVVPVNKSQVVRFDRPFREINVGSKDIAAVVPLSRMTAVVIGKKQGSTNLTLSDASGHIIAVVDVDVTYDVEGLQRRIHDLMPDEQVSIQPAGDMLVLSGHVSSSDHLHQIAVLAAGYAAPDKITNLLAIGGSQQVLLEVRFTEISRSAAKDLGISTDLDLNKVGNGNGVNNTIFADTGTPLSVTPFGTIAGMFSGHNFELNLKLEALETKGLLRTLAEPNLVALSGQTASFLAGGEFPVPVAQGSSSAGTAISVEFKDFGVGLGFTPTVIGKDLINLSMSSEVSSLDSANGVIEDTFKIPALKVRRAKTVIDLHDGESFAIGGLMQDDFTDSVGQFPGLGSLPIIGALFRSTNFQHDQTELAVFITVHLVQPQVQKNLAAPTDTTQQPNSLGLFGLGQTQRQGAPVKPSGNGEVMP